VRHFPHPADWKSTTQQTGSLRYFGCGFAALCLSACIRGQQLLRATPTAEFNPNSEVKKRVAKARRLERGIYAASPLACFSAFVNRRRNGR